MSNDKYWVKNDTNLVKNDTNWRFFQNLVKNEKISYFLVTYAWKLTKIKLKMESKMTKIEDFLLNLVKNVKICYFFVKFAW